MSETATEDQELGAGDEHNRELAALTDQEFVERAAMWMEALVIWTPPHVKRLRDIASRLTRS